MSLADTQHWNPTQYAEQGRFVSELGMPVVVLLAPQAGEHILDLGCGDGALTIKLRELGCSVVGVDAGTEMVAAAQSLGLEAHVIDGQSLPYHKEFDAVFSNAALHWMQHPQQVLAGIWQALKTGGRFVAEFGAQGNVVTIVSALETALTARGLPVNNPWYFPNSEGYRQLLEARGFQVQTLERIPRPTLLPGDVGGWLKTFAQTHLSVVPEAEQANLIRDVIETLRPRLCDAKGDWYADYVRLRVSAFKADK